MLKCSPFAFNLQCFPPKCHCHHALITAPELSLRLLHIIWALTATLLFPLAIYYWLVFIWKPSHYLVIVEKSISCEFDQPLIIPEELQGSPLTCGFDFTLDIFCTSLKISTPHSRFSVYFNPYMYSLNPIKILLSYCVLWSLSDAVRVVLTTTILSAHRFSLLYLVCVHTKSKHTSL